MSLTCACHDGNHGRCEGKVSKWYAEKGDTVLEVGLIASDGVGVMVGCSCSCHLHPAGMALADKVELERVASVRGFAL